MKCTQCNQDMIICDSKISSEMNTTTVMLYQKYKCINADCSRFDEIQRTVETVVSDGV